MAKKSSGYKGKPGGGSSGESPTPNDNRYEDFETASRSADQERASIESSSDADTDKGKWLPGLATDHLERIEKAERGELDDVDFDENVSLSLDMAYMNLGVGGITIERIFGQDDRKRIENPNTFPYKRICHLTFNTPGGGGFVGTGWLAGPRLVITAGHCVYNRDSRFGVGWSSNMKIYPARNGNTKPAQGTAADLVTVKAWRARGQQEADFGAVILNEPLGEEFGWFAFATATDSELRGLKATLVGYSGDKPTGTLWAHANKITDVSNRRIHYLMDTWGGNSGGPVITSSEDEWVSMGIHNYGGNESNYATRITDDVFKVLESWQDW